MDPSTDRKLLRIERRFRQVFEHLNPSQLTAAGQADDEWPTNIQPLLDESCSEQDRFLGYYCRRGLEIVFDRYGLTGLLRKQGLADFHFSLDKHPDGYDILRVSSPDSPHHLIELVACIASLPPTCKQPADAAQRRLLNIKFLRMQNPFKQPAADRPLLPGQSFPGLGIGREMMTLLQLICVRLDLDGVLALPERLHNAVLYFRRYRFLDPDLQGIVTAILRDTREQDLNELAWGMEHGGLIDLNTNKPYRWIPSEQVLVRSGPLLAYLQAEEYLQQARNTMEHNRFMLTTSDPSLGLSDMPSAIDLDLSLPSRIK
jgi:hypothetical protein